MKVSYETLICLYKKKEHLFFKCVIVAFRYISV